MSCAPLRPTLLRRIVGLAAGPRAAAAAAAPLRPGARRACAGAEPTGTTPTRGRRRRPGRNPARRGHGTTTARRDRRGAGRARARQRRLQLTADDAPERAGRDPAAPLRRADDPRAAEGADRDRRAGGRADPRLRHDGGPADRRRLRDRGGDADDAACRDRRRHRVEVGGRADEDRRAAAPSRPVRAHRPRRLGEDVHGEDVRADARGASPAPRTARDLRRGQLAMALDGPLVPLGAVLLQRRRQRRIPPSGSTPPDVPPRATPH